jgi:hypothetical protein
VGRPGLRIPDSVRWLRRRCRSGESWFHFEMQWISGPFCCLF